MAASTLSLSYDTKLGWEIGICSNMGRKDNRNPKDCRWEITAYFCRLPDVNTSKDAGMWVRTDAKQWEQPPFIVPIKSMTSEPLGLQLYLEQPTSSEPNSWLTESL